MIFNGQLTKNPFINCHPRGRARIHTIMINSVIVMMYKNTRLCIQPTQIIIISSLLVKFSPVFHLKYNIPVLASKASQRKQRLYESEEDSCQLPLSSNHMNICQRKKMRKFNECKFEDKLLRLHTGVVKYPLEP